MNNNINIKKPADHSGFFFDLYFTMENNFKLKIRKKKLLADTITPVGLYLKIRDKYAKSFLLESSDYHGGENAFSYICCDPLANFKLENLQLEMSFPDGSTEKKELQSTTVLPALRAFLERFSVEDEEVKHIQTGLFGYMAYDAVQFYEDITFSNVKTESAQIPQIQYCVFKYIIALDHFKNECHLIECYTEEPDDASIAAAGSDPEFKRSMEIRKSAMRALIDLDHSEKWRDAIKFPSRRAECSMFLPGHQVFFWKKAQTTSNLKGRRS